MSKVGKWTTSTQVSRVLQVMRTPIDSCRLAHTFFAESGPRDFHVSTQPFRVELTTRTHLIRPLPSLLSSYMYRPLLAKATLKPALHRTFTSSAIRMGVTVETLSPGDGKNFPKKGEMVSSGNIGPC